MGALLCLAWIPLVVLAGTVVTPRLSPATRGGLLGGTGPAYAVLAVLLAVPIGLAMLGGWQLRGPDDPDSPWFLPITFGVVLGAPAAAVAGIVWQRARRLTRLDQRVPGPWLPASDPDRMTTMPAPRAPLPGATAPQRAHRADRGLRRARTALFALAFCGHMLARAFQSRNLGADVPPQLLLLILVPLLAGVALTLLLRRRHRVAGSRAPADLEVLAHSHGWVLTRNDTERVPTRFPAAPFMRPQRLRDVVEQVVVVDGASGGHPWWAVEQRGVVNDGYWSDRASRTVVVTELAGAALPSVTVAGRDTTGVLDWFLDSVRLESDDLNQRLMVTTARGSEAAAWAVMNPRMMEHVLAHLPDGATLAFGGNTVSVVLPRALRTGDLATVPSFCLGAAALLPSTLVRATRA